MLAIYNANEQVAFQAPQTSSHTKKKDPKGNKPRAKSGHGKIIPDDKSHPQSKIEATKSASLLKEATKSQVGHSKKRKKSSTAKDTNLIQPPASTLVVDGMHKEVHQATSGPTSLGVTGEEGADPQLSSDNDALAAFTYEVDLDKSVPKDLLSQKQGNDEGTQNISFDHIVVGTNPIVIVDKTQSTGDGLEIIHIKTGTKKDANND
ncbi:hypothetical protein Tco_1178350 [Tanacetum coccineum]